MALLEDTIRRSHGTIVAAKYPSAREHFRQKCLNLAKKEQWRIHDLQPEDGNIGIDAVRRLYTYTSYRQRGRQSLMVLVNESQTMTQPAQNSFLKLLEEPPRGVKFVLFCPEPSALLITIRSRCQVVHIRPLSLADFKKKFPKLDGAELTALYYASSGDVIEANRLHAESDNSLQTVRELLSKPLGEAVMDLSDAASSRDKAEATIDQFGKLAHAALRHAKSDEKRRVWLKRLEASLEAKEQVIAQSNLKLIMDKLLLEFRL